MNPKPISRALLNVITPKLFKGKAIIILGPRQTGKTTLLKALTAGIDKPKQWINCDDPTSQRLLEGATIASLRSIIGSDQLIVVDEAQRVRNIGLTLKLVTDEFKHVQLLVGGSSALEPANEINEPLTGRKWEYLLYPISWGELVHSTSFTSAMQQLEQRLLYGMYPEVVTNPGREKELLNQIVSSYLYKDLLSFKGIRKPELLDKLLRALALQLGQEVSYNELANLLQVDKGTVSDYIYLLEQAFIVARLQPLSRNLRSEIGTMRKLYFWDLGVRNALIGNFNPLSIRSDAGAVWENFLIVERMKHLHYNSDYGNKYFWRTKAQQEIDYVEERDGRLFAYEFKMNPKAKYKFSKTFTSAYPEASTEVIHMENFHDFLTKPFLL